MSNFYVSATANSQLYKNVARINDWTVCENS